jgi:cell wall-associated NlpC family hydrolase
MNGEEGSRSACPAVLALLALGLAACSSSPPPRADREAAVVAPAPAGDVGARAAHVALAQLGEPYRYGGDGPGGFDCSGLVQYSYLQAGKALPRTTGQLWSVAQTVGRSELRPGDLLFFSIAGKMQHVGLYVGEGQFVHAPSSGRQVSVASLGSAYYQDAFLRAGRPP